MKIALTTSGQDLESTLEGRFGRARRFVIYDTDNESVVVVDNEQHREATQGAGIQAAGIVARCGAGCVVTGHCGPKAFAVLAAAGIEVLNSQAATVREALQEYREGRLRALSSADREGHWA